MADIERMAIEHAMRVSDASPTAAARKLGISTATIYRKLKSW